MDPASVSQLATALDDTGRLIGSVGADQWAAPTPCADWTVRDLVNHLIRGNRVFTAALRGEPAPDQPTQDQPAPDQPTTAHATYRESAADLLAAFDLPGVADRIVTVPVGVVPGRVALHLRVVESLVHGWDLARATGQSFEPSPALAEQELAFTRAMLGTVPADRSPFAAPQPVPDDAPAIDRLAGCLGRSVG